MQSSKLQEQLVDKLVYIKSILSTLANLAKQPIASLYNMQKQYIESNIQSGSIHEMGDLFIRSLSSLIGGFKAFDLAFVYQIDVIQSRGRKCQRITVIRSNPSYNIIGGRLLFEQMEHHLLDWIVDQMCQLLGGLSYPRLPIWIKHHLLLTLQVLKHMNQKVQRLYFRMNQEVDGTSGSALYKLLLLQMVSFVIQV